MAEQAFVKKEPVLTYTVNNSILSFTGSSGSFTAGSVTLGGTTVTYRPGSGTDPDYVNDDPAWDGLGNDFNSLTYGTSKGYYAP